MTPDPETLAAWADGELPPREAAAVEAWLASRPDDRRDAEALRAVDRLFRDNPPAEPPPAAWAAALNRVGSHVRPPRRRLLPRAALAAAAALAAVVVARPLWTPAPVALVAPAEDDEEEPWAGARASEVHIIGVDAGDADRILTGGPLMGAMEFAGDGDIDVVGVEPDRLDGARPRLERRGGVPLVVVARAEEGP